MIKIWRSESEGFPVEWVNDVSIVVNFPSSHPRFSSPTWIQQSSGTFNPSCDVRMKFLPSLCGCTPEPGFCRAKQTPLTASGILIDRKRSYVLGNWEHVSVFHTPSLWSLIALQPVPITWFCHIESEANKFGFRSFEFCDMSISQVFLWESMLSVSDLKGNSTTPPD